VFCIFWPHARAWSLNLAISNFFSSKDGDFWAISFFSPNYFLHFLISNFGDFFFSKFEFATKKIQKLKFGQKKTKRLTSYYSQEKIPQNVFLIINK
jgi:hypothetical protein